MSARPWTAGPWAMAWEDGKHGVVGSETAGKLVCFVGNNTPDDGLEPTRKANARLIAASPDLAEALIAAREFIRNGIDLGYIRMPDADTEDPAHETAAKIDAALAKAGAE